LEIFGKSKLQFTSLKSSNSIAKFKKEPSLLQIMTLPKGYKPSAQTGSGSSNSGSSNSGGGSSGSSGASRDEIERMIGRRVENMRGIIVLGFILCWVATAGGVYVGVTVYPWAYPLPSGLYALSVLTVIEVLGMIWMLKIAGEKPVRM
jgi:hypothetical protein